MALGHLPCPKSCLCLCFCFVVLLVGRRRSSFFSFCCGVRVVNCCFACSRCSFCVVCLFLGCAWGVLLFFSAEACNVCVPKAGPIAASTASLVSSVLSRLSCPCLVLFVWWHACTGLHEPAHHAFAAPVLSPLRLQSYLFLVFSSVFRFQAPCCP